MAIRSSWRDDLYLTERNARASFFFFCLSPVAGSLIALAQPHLYDSILGMLFGAMLHASVWTIVPALGYHSATSHLRTLRHQQPDQNGS